MMYMNLIDKRLVTGTIGELLVQVRLLQFGVQSAPPIKDSGNDLIAVRAHTVRSIQVKTTAGRDYGEKGLPRLYHILVVVHLAGEGSNLLLDTSHVFLISRERVAEAPRNINQLDEYSLNRAHIDALFSPSTAT